MAIEGSRKENVEENYSKKIGLFTAKVIAINPDEEEYKELLGIELKEDSKATEYLGTSKDGNTFLRVDVWLEELVNSQKFKVTFFLEDKNRENKEGTKKQYINNTGSCSWAGDEDDLPTWFKSSEYRVAKNGEEDLYSFLKIWLSHFDFKKDKAVFDMEWKKLMKGNVKLLKNEIDGEWCSNIIALATVTVKEKEGEIKEYQTIWNKGFLYEDSLRFFKLVDYSDPYILQNLNNKKPKDLKSHERFVLNCTSAYGCKDLFILKPLKDYNSEDFAISSSNAPILNSDNDSSSY